MIIRAKISIKEQVGYCCALAPFSDYSKLVLIASPMDTSAVAMLSSLFDSAIESEDLTEKDIRYSLLWNKKPSKTEPVEAIVANLNDGSERTVLLEPVTNSMFRSHDELINIFTFKQVPF